MLNRREMVAGTLSSLASAAAILPARSDLAAENCNSVDQEQRAVHLAMGFRVGEVSQHSAIVWTRVTANAEPNLNGKKPSPLESPTRTTVVNEDIPIAEREGAVPGTSGQVRLVYSTHQQLKDAQSTNWFPVSSDSDYVHQFTLDKLDAATRYYLRVEARATESSSVTQSPLGSFETPAKADQWQDVRFAATTCQMYYHRDLPDGFRIYPSMAGLGIKFLASTGDSVYYDRDNPRACTPELCRFHWHRMYSLPKLVEFFRSVPAYWEKDDHDTFFDDCWTDYQAPWIAPLTYAQGVQVYREQVPIGRQLYRTLRWGSGLQIWLVEGRDFRSPNTAPDGPEKSIWGQAQKEWLKRTILESDAAFRILISPTAIVGRDNSNQRDNHANVSFAFEGNEFRQWTRRNGLKNFYVICGDRHWQYMSTDPGTGLREFACGPASDIHAVPGPGFDPAYHSFYRAAGGFLSIDVFRTNDGPPTIAFRHHDVDGKVLFEYRDTSIVRGT